MPNYLISHASIESIKTIFSYLKQNNAQFVFWIRTPDYERQLYISPTYEGIWKRPRDKLYQDPKSWLNTLMEEDRGGISEKLLLPNSNMTIFRIHTPDGQLRWIKDYSFNLCNTDGNIVAVAGFGECIEEKEWLILSSNPHEKRIENAVMDMFLNFTNGFYSSKENFSPQVNLFGTSSNKFMCIDDLIAALTKREFECLCHLMRDMTAKQSAKKLNISHRTVETYLTNIKGKINVNSNLALVGKLQGLIERININDNDE